MDISFSNLISAIAIILAIYGIVKGQLIDARDTERRFVILEENQVSKTDFAAMQKQVELFWSIVEKGMAEMLHSPHTPEFDTLLDKLKNNTATFDDKEKLLSMLDAEISEITQNTDNPPAVPIDKRSIVLGLIQLKAVITARMS